MLPSKSEAHSVSFARFVSATAPDADVRAFICDCDELPDVLDNCVMVMTDGDEARAETLLERGAACVLLADAAMRDSTCVARLVERYSAERIGVTLQAAKRHVSWTMDMVSNADFRCLTPSYGKIGWEIVMSDGTLSGTDVEWWVGEMRALGAAVVLIQADVEDDDLNLCAGLVETHGDAIWFTPWKQPDADLEPWVRYGQIRQIVLPLADVRDESELERIRAAASAAQPTENVNEESIWGNA